MKVDNAKIHKILFITLSNVGDVVLTLPVLGVLKREFPSAGITVIVGPGGKELFGADQSVTDIIVYDKHLSLSEKMRLVLRMRRLRFDMVVDLRHSLLPLLIGARYNTSFIQRPYPNIHRKDKHLKSLSIFGISVDSAGFSISLSRDDKLRVNSLLSEFGILPDDNMAAIAAGAKSHIKRWTITGFIRLCDILNKETGVKILLIGDDSDRAINKEIKEAGLKEVYDLSGRTNLRELAYLLSLCKLLVSNDSAPVHIASSVGLPTIAIFGPTDDKKYGPLLPNSRVIRKDLSCSPCEKAWCRLHLDCMNEVSADEVFKACKEILWKLKI